MAFYPGGRRGLALSDPVGGRRRHAFDDGSFDAVDCERWSCWASGQRGAAAVLRGG